MFGFITIHKTKYGIEHVLFLITLMFRDILNLIFCRAIRLLLCNALLLLICKEGYCDSSASSQLASSAPVFSRDQFIFSYGRVGVGNDFIARDSKQSNALAECAASNTITRLKGMDVDYESYYCTLMYETDILGARVSLQSSLLHTTGGFFDSAIETFHQALHLPNGSRGRTEEDRFSAQVTQNGQTVSLERSSVSFLDPQLSLSKKITSFSQTAVYLDFSTTLPLNESQYSLSLPELKSSIVLDTTVSDDFYMLFGSSVIFHLDDTQYGLAYDPFSAGIFITTQWILSDSILPRGLYFLNESTVFTQNVFSTNNQQKFTNLYWYYWYLDVGMRIPTYEGQALEIILRENPSPGSGTVDVSLMLRYIF